MEPRLHEKNQKNLMRGFLGKCRTDGRTDRRESIGPEDSRILETKNVTQHFSGAVEVVES